VTGNDITWPQVTGSDPEVTSFGQKLPGSGFWRPKTPVYCAFHFLQGYSLQNKAVTWLDMTSRDLRWLDMNRKWRHLTRCHLEVAVEGQKSSYTVHFTSYKAVAHRRRQSRDRKWRHVISGDRKWPASDAIWPEVTGSRSRKSTQMFCTYHFLQSGRPQKELVTWQEVTSRDLSWPQVTWKWRHLTGSHLEMAVEGQKHPYTVHFTSFNALAHRRIQSHDRKWHHVTSGRQEVTRKWRHLTGSSLEVAVQGHKRTYTVHFTSYKVVAGRKRQSRDRKGRHVTSGDRKWPASDIIWPEVTCKWL